MTEIWAQAALWLGLALIATLLSIRLKIATALSEIVVGTIAQLLIGALIGSAVLGTGETWIKFLSGTGAIVLTFLAGAERDPDVFRAKWKEAGAIGFVSFLAPFLRAGSFVSVPALIAAPIAFLFLLVAKLGTKIVGVYLVTRAFGQPHQEGMYTTLMMSTGLTFGTISSLFGLSHGIIDQAQYSILVATVIGSAVVPTLIANAVYLPRHLLRGTPAEEVTGNLQPAGKIERH